MFRKKFLSMLLLMGMLISQSVPQALAQTNCDHAQFVSDLTAPDGSSFATGAAFTKTWRLMNIGTCTWTTSYNLVWVGGDAIGAPASVQLPAEVPPGQMVDVSVNLTAPSTSGHYRALFKISNAAGTQFGIGDSASDPFWADINAVATSGVIYDFVANAAYAQWRSGAGALPFPGTSGDSRGFAYQVDQPHLEDDSLDSVPGLFVAPQNKFNGYIQAAYPEFEIQQGDHLQTLVNCEFGARNCYVTFRIDYIQPNGVQRTLWSWKEAYDSRFYRADIDLSRLAGQRVRFVFMLLASGFASGDRAIWGSPRIVRAGSTQPPAPPATLTALPPLPATPTPFSQPPTVQPSGCDKAAFVTDVNVPDGTIFSPGAAFTKTWQLRNIGSCTWTTSYKLIYYSGEAMGAPTAVNLPWTAAPNQTVDVSVNMVAPAAAGEYRGYWILANANGQLFGIGAAASDPIWVEINVAGEAPIGTGYDFASNVCSAEWRSGAGVLPCPGADGNRNGFILKLDAPKLEDGSTGAPGLLAVPQNRFNGYIQGFYPTFTVQPGDRFQSTVGCEFGAACYLTFRLDYMTASGYIATFWQWREQNEGKVYNADIDLTPLAGRSVRFILTILAAGTASSDRALWGVPRIARAGSAPPTITPVPPSDTPSPIPPTNDWPLYTNTRFGFQFKYPPQSERFFETDYGILVKMPIAPGTNLVEKYLQAIVTENANPCRSPLATSSMLSSSETVVINGISFLKETGGDAGAGQIHEWVAYSTPKDNNCISMDFVLHSTNPGNYATPPPVFDRAAESIVFAQIMSTFGLAASPITTVPPTVPPVVVPSPDIRQLYMLNPNSGWALNNSQVLRTADGGATWYNVNPPGIVSVRNGFFRDANKAWVIGQFPGPDGGSAPAVFRTTDGGLNWAQFNVQFQTASYIQFLDDTNGFVLDGVGIGMQKHPVSLYQTADGGATWTLKFAHDPNQPNNGLPLSGHKNGMSFRNTSTGWIGGEVPTDGVYIFKTTNGGTTWAQQPLTLPVGNESAITSTTAPVFFGANDAILPVRMDGNAGKGIFLYVTSNGGATWNLSPAFAPAYSHVYDFVSVRDGFVWDAAGVFHVTNNSGTSWSQVTPNVNFGDGVRMVDFVSTTTGWIYDSDSTGNTALYRTVDGGRNWSRLFGTIPITPVPEFSPDLTIVEMHIELQNPSCLMSGDVMGVRLWVKNNGQGAAGSFVVRVNGVDQTVNSLGVGETTAVFFPNYSNPVTALVDATNLITETDEGNNSRSEMVPIPTPPLPCVTPTFTPTATPSTPIALIGPYAVIRVLPEEVLNIHTAAGDSQPIVGSFPADAVNVMRTGPTASVDGATWVEVQNPSGGTGWVNSTYLTEYVTHDAFCADTRIPILLEQLKGSMNQSNGDMFAGLVDPVHGVDVHLWAYQMPVNFNTTTARTVFTSTEPYNWGSGPRGEADLGTFKDIIQPRMLDVLNASTMETYCDNLTKVFPLARPWPFSDNIHYYNLYRPSSSPAQLDFRTWLIGFEYINGQPYLRGMVTIVWEP